jgi:hypothetical protein
MNPYSHVFLADAGSNVALEAIQKVIRSSDFPRKFLPRARNLQKRILYLDRALEGLSERARDKLRSKSARYYELTSDASKNLAWVIQGLSNALRELTLAEKQAPGQTFEIRDLIKETQLLHYEANTLFEEVQEYLEGFHPLDWAEEVYGDLTKNFPSFSGVGLGGRPAVVASRWQAKKASPR